MLEHNPAERIQEGKTRYILMIDDDPDDCLLVHESINEALPFVEFSCINDGEEAIEYLMLNRPVNYKLPSLILLDINMPKLDGWSVLRRLQEDPFLRDIPVIIFTTYFDDQNRKLAVRGGFQIEKKPTNETDYHVFIGKLASYIYN